MTVEKLIDNLRLTIPDYLLQDLEEYIAEESSESLLGISANLIMFVDRCNDFPEFWPRYEGGLYHLTTVENWRAIQESGNILPSGSGHHGEHRLKPGYQTLAQVHQAVALFDLRGLGTKKFKCGLVWMDTIDRLVGDSIGVWLTVDRDTLPLPIECFSGVKENLFLPHAEAHHRGPIPLECVTRAEAFIRLPSGCLQIAPLS